MKIGIITFWQSDDNYGQVLQCWALQQQLKRMGHDPFLIKFSPQEKASISWNTKLRKAILIYPLIRKILREIKKKQRAQKIKLIASKNTQRLFNEFKKEYIKSEDKVYHSLSEIQKNPPVADCYICGSDQVWSMLLNNNENKAYFLDFGESNLKRIAYAASFGCDIYPPKFNKLLHDLLAKFNAISVREDTGVAICERIGIQACKTLDPTLLLSSTDYLFLMDHNKVKQPYFYTYSLNITSAKDLYWKELTAYVSKKGLISISTTSSGYFPGQEICSDTHYVYATIPQWLGYINNAEFVATTSFHGVVFCLILNKNFIYFPLKGSYAKGNNRVLALLKAINIMEKVCWKKEDISKCVEYSINWEIVNELIKSMRQKSQSFLHTNL